MTVLEIVDVGHPVLRVRADEVPSEEFASPGFQAFVDDLVATLREAGGAGLAANQVADTRRVAVVEVRQPHPRYPYKPPIPLTVLVNPVLETLDEETSVINEGCLSVPDLRGEVQRHARVRVRSLDRNGHPQEHTFAGLSAGTIQHEVDHLDGVLFLDRVTDTRTLTTWAQFDVHQRAAFEARAGAIVERYGG